MTPHTYELDCRYDRCKSFYGKAHVTEYPDEVRLTSYSTHVATIYPLVNNGRAYAKDTYSMTTLRHIKEFLKQAGFKAETAKQIMADYGQKVEA
jgi:hypothetical protein